jgi:outer membrane protein OmpA-like peptidoglycan-associated protein
METYSTTVYERSANIYENMTDKQVIEEHQIFFAFGKDKLSTEGQEALKVIAGIMKENADIVLQINGHNNAQEDEVGKENDYYADMDIKRIGVVMKHLMDAGIEESRLMSNPQGTDSPNADITSSDDDDLRMANNRRITFKAR